MSVRVSREQPPQVPQTVPAVVIEHRTSAPHRIRYATVARPELGPDELLIEPAFVGLCGSDLELLRGHLDADFDVTYPHVLGHEWSGRIVAVGRTVPGTFAVGDLVIGHGDLGGNHWFGVTDHGAMAGHFTIRADMCFTVPSNISEQRAALIEPLACVLQALRSGGGADGSDVVAVFGCGSLGLAMIALVASTGAQVIAIDPSAERLKIADTLGATLTLQPDNDLRSTIENRFGTAATLVVEASGATAAQVAALEVTAARARVVFMGITDAPARNVRLGAIVARNLTITSSTGAAADVWPRALRLLEATDLDLTPLVTQVFAFAECEAAFQAAANPQAGGKVMLRPTDEISDCV